MKLRPWLVLRPEADLPRAPDALRAALEALPGASGAVQTLGARRFVPGDRSNGFVEFFLGDGSLRVQTDLGGVSVEVRVESAQRDGPVSWHPSTVSLTLEPVDGAAWALWDRAVGAIESLGYEDRSLTAWFVVESLREVADPSFRAELDDRRVAAWLAALRTRDSLDLQHHEARMVRTILARVEEPERVRTLELARTGFRRVPVEVRRFTGLQRLNLRRTRVRELPDFLWDLPLVGVELHGTPLARDADALAAVRARAGQCRLSH